MQYSYTGKTLGYELTTEEQRWLKYHQPKLFYFHEERKAYGYFSFRSSFQNCVIPDEYEIKIDFARLEYKMIPYVYEVGNRIERAARLYNKPLIDLHQYEDHHLCLIRPDVFVGLFIKRGFFISDLCILINSFLYWQSYFYTFGKEPWPGEEHGLDWLKL